MERKRKYIKPEMRVAEWDFNEAVCDTILYNTSGCSNLIINGTGGASAMENRPQYTGGHLNWSPVSDEN